MLIESDFFADEARRTANYAYVCGGRNLRLGVDPCGA